MKKQDRQLATSKGAKGYSLIELMIGMSMGLVLIMGVTALYVQSSNNYERMTFEAQRISNTQYVGNLLRRELQGAGFWGSFIFGFEDPGVLVNPCSLLLDDFRKAVSQPVIGYDSPAASPLLCLDNANFKANTDILVIRRASGIRVSDPSQMVDGDMYIQANPVQFLIEAGSSAGFTPAELGADNSIVQEGTTPAGNVATIMIKRNTATANPVDTATRFAADVRRFRSDIYFISPCTIPSDMSDVCTGGDDDGGEPVPSMKKLELSAVSGALKYEILTIAEGVEDMQILYGIDTSDPQSSGRGIPDIFVAAPTVEQLQAVVSLQVSLLLRDKRPSAFLDQNIYTLAGEDIEPFGDYYSRQVLNSNYRITNQSNRRSDAY